MSGGRGLTKSGRWYRRTGAARRFAFATTVSPELMRNQEFASRRPISPGALPRPPGPIMAAWRLRLLLHARRFRWRRRRRIGRRLHGGYQFDRKRDCRFEFGRKRKALEQLELIRQQRRIPAAAERLDQADAGKKQILPDGQDGFFIGQQSQVGR